MKKARGKIVGLAAIAAVLLLAVCTVWNAQQGTAVAAALDEDVVDASAFDDPEQVTLVAAPELTEEQFAAIAQEAAAAVAAADEDEDVPYSADGTMIMSIAAVWITEDEAEDDSDSRLTLVKSSNSDFSVKMQVSFELSGQYDYEIGEITITIPKSIFADRDGNAAGTVTLSVPEAPDTSATFSYTETEDAYILTNTKKLTAASNIMFEIGIEDLIPSELIGNGELADGEVSDSGVVKYITEEFSATIEVITHEGNTISRTSNTLDASIDTEEEIGNADLKSNGLSTAFPLGLGR